jgi:hypothetical protein
VLVTASMVFKVAVSASDCSSSDRKTNDLFACELALRGGKQYVSNCKQGEDFTRKKHCLVHLVIDWLFFVEVPIYT